MMLLILTLSIFPITGFVRRHFTYLLYGILETDNTCPLIDLYKNQPIPHIAKMLAI